MSFLASCPWCSARERIEGVLGVGKGHFANAGSRLIESRDGFTDFSKVLF